jgi:hypothetical protein
VRQALLALIVAMSVPVAVRAQEPSRVDSLMAAGRAATARGDHPEAWRLFRAAYDPAADDPRVLATLAGAAASLGDLARFRAVLDSIVGPGPGPRHALEYWAALSLDASVAPVAVRDELDEHLAARPTDIETLLAFVGVLRAHRRETIAGELLEGAIGRGVERASVAVALGDLRRDAGDAPSAIDAYLEAADSSQATQRIQGLLAAHPPGHARDPLVERLRRARDGGAESAARMAATLLAELDRPSAEESSPEVVEEPSSSTDLLAVARDTTALAAALADARARVTDAPLFALRSGDLWLARGQADSAVASYARAADPSIAPELGAATLEALARIRLVRSLAGMPRTALSGLGALLVEAPAEPGAAAAKLDSLVASAGLADTSAARPLAAALAAEWRGRAGDATGASAALEAAAATAGPESAALLLAAGRWAAVARESDRARALWRLVVERYGETPYALEARRLLAQPGGEGR